MADRKVFVVISSGCVTLRSRRKTKEGIGHGSRTKVREVDSRIHIINM